MATQRTRQLNILEVPRSGGEKQKEEGGEEANGEEGGEG